MPHIESHPAPGLAARMGDFVPGYFVVPQNPVRDGTEIIRVPRMGEILASKYRVPHNPLVDRVRAGLSGCSAEEPGPMLFQGGLISAPETSDAVAPDNLFMHIAAGGLITAMVLGLFLRGRKGGRF